MSEIQLILGLYLLVGLRLLLYARPGLLAETPRLWINETVDAFVLAGVIAVLLINFVVRSFYIPSSSMEPTLATNDFILVDELVYRVLPPRRGDIVVFRSPHQGERDFIKRVVGVEGDVIEVREGALYRNGYRIRESYVPEPIHGTFGPEVVRPGHLFMMGDNRNNSADSRNWSQLPVGQVEGRAFMVFMNSALPYKIKLRRLPGDEGAPGP